MASSPRLLGSTEYSCMVATPDDSLRVPAFIGSITVPESHQTGEGRLELHYVRIPARASRPAEPWVYLAGGPGTSAVDSLHRNLRIFLALAGTSDVIAIDQRGAGHSRPALDNSEHVERPASGPFTRTQYLESYRRAALHAAERWRSAGVHLDRYNTEENADDIAALREALRADSISIFGASYGSHLSLSVIRRHSEMLRRVAIALVEGPDDTVKLPSRVEGALEVVAGLARDAEELEGRCPDLLGLMRSVFERLDREPALLNVTGADGEPSQVQVGGFEARLLVAHSLGRAAVAAALPGDFLRMEMGDHAPLQRLLDSGRARWLASAMTHAMDAASGASQERRERIRQEARETVLADLIDFPIPEVGEAWGVTQLPDEFRAPVKSSLPVLLISGALDPRTPPVNAEEVLQHLDTGVHVVVDGIGHDNFVTIPTLAETVRGFLDHGVVDRMRVALPFSFQPVATPAMSRP